VASRRDFFKSIVAPLKQTKEEPSHRVVRPPYGLSESLFQSECPACENKACVASCDEKIIIIAEDGTPELNFASSGCTFCDECATVCEAGVLDLEHGQYNSKLNADFAISLTSCVAHNGVICFSCKEPCLDDAILFNGMFNPIIDMSRCSGCGFCISVCPTDAIECSPLEMKIITESEI